MFSRILLFSLMLASMPVLAQEPVRFTNLGYEQGLSQITINCILQDRDGFLWMGTQGGLNFYDGYKIRAYQQEPGNPNSLSDDNIQCLAEDGEGRLLIGMVGGGLNVFTRETGRFERYSANDSLPLIPDNNSWRILIDHQERLWLGTSSGICLFPAPPRNNTFIHLGNREGLPKSVVMGLVADSEHDIWMSTFDGLVRLRADSLEAWLASPGKTPGSLFRRYHTDEGLQSNGFGQGAYGISAEGFISFGGINGVNRFRAREVHDNPYTPEVRITGLKVYNQEIRIDPDLTEDQGVCRLVERVGNYYLPTTIPWVKALKISSRIKVISFDFSALHFSRPANNQYAYKLENFDPEWNQAGAKHDATYTNLPPEKYIFKVRGTNSDGVWNHQPLELPLTVIPMFHQTKLFTGLLVFAILGLFSAFVAAMFRSHQLKARREKEFVELQLRTVKNQIDPHFTFNVINTVAGMVYKGNPDRTYDYFSRFARLIRTSLDNSDRLKVSLGEEIEFVRNYLELEKARYADDFQFSFMISPDVDLETEVPKMIIQIFAENAMKHGLRHKKDDKRLTIKCYCIEKNLVIEIGDNGIGRVAASSQKDHSSGKGLEIIRRLTELYRRLYGKSVSFRLIDLQSDDGKPAGTRVEVILAVL